MGRFTQGHTQGLEERFTGKLFIKSRVLRTPTIPGSSEYFERGVVTYSNAAKTEMLGVPAALMDRRGAVSREVAEAMAQGIREAARTDLGLSVTGIAGPDGGSKEKP